MSGNRGIVPAWPPGALDTWPFIGRNDDVLWPSNGTASPVRTSVSAERPGQESAPVASRKSKVRRNVEGRPTLALASERASLSEKASLEAPETKGGVLVRLLKFMIGGASSGAKVDEGTMSVTSEGRAGGRFTLLTQGGGERVGKKWGNFNAESLRLVSGH
jgi:hypothetical protein